MNVTEFFFSCLILLIILPALTTTFKLYFWKMVLLETLFNIDKNSTDYLRFSSKAQYKFVSTPEVQR